MPRDEAYYDAFEGTDVGNIFGGYTRRRHLTPRVGILIPGKVIAQAAEDKFGRDQIRYDHIPPKAAAPIFPVLQYDGKIKSSLQRSQVLARMPEIGVDNVYCDKAIYEDAIEWRKSNKNTLLKLK